VRAYIRDVAVAQRRAVMRMTACDPDIVLVHGAWADATGFDAEIRALRNRGYSAIGFAIRFRDLAGDAAYLAEFLRTVSGSIVLVGHSYGGNVILRRPIGNERVQALVTSTVGCATWAKPAASSSRDFEGSLVGPSIRPVPFTTPTGARAPTFTSPPRRSAKPSPRRSNLRSPQ